MHFDLSNLGSGNGGLAEMMKMFAPMMQGIVGGINQPPKESETTAENTKHSEEKGSA